MKGAVIVGALVVNLSAAVATGVAAPFSAGAYAARCGTDGDIPSAERRAMDATALRLVQDLLAGDTASVFQQLTPAAQSATGPNGLAAVEQFLKIGVPFQDVRVAHTYAISVARVGGAPVPPLHCGKDLKDPDAVLLAVATAPKQFDVEVTAHSRNNDWSTFVILVPEQGVWKALSFHVTISAMSGRSARDLRQLARVQAAKGHKLNAALLYRAAAGLADRGPNAAPVWKRDLTKEAEAFVSPAELQGAPPFKWRLGDQVFDVADASIIGIGGSFSLIIERRTTSWPDNATADRDARSLTTAVVAAHPELAEVFAGVVVRSFKPDRSGGFGTVYEFGKGFDGPTP